jgi:AmmeMemoRadiSam system protein B
LEAKLDRYLEEVEETSPTHGVPDRDVRGLVSPHIDYERGGAVYAGVWRRAAASIREVELAIMFGTDHIGGGKLTLTHQRYATPWGVLPTASRIVDDVVEAIGADVAFGKELHHRTEHSIELAVVWLHHALGGRECELVPVLCSGFEEYVESDRSPGDDADLAAALEVLRDAAASCKTVIIAAGDLAHVGPAFGDGYAIDILEKARLRSADEELIARICDGDEEGFLGQIRAERDRHRVCGLPPIYMALRLLGETHGDLTGYAQCPADGQGTSLVSICGVALS